MPIPTSDTASIQRRLVVDTITDQVRDWIFTGQLTPGEQLVVDDIATAVGASRTPVREALNRLTGMGLVDTIPNKSTRVTTPTPGEAADAAATLHVLADVLAGCDTEAGELHELVDTTTEHPTPERIGEVRVRFLAAAEYCPNTIMGRLTTTGIDGILYRLTVPAPAFGAVGVSA